MLLFGQKQQPESLLLLDPGRELMLFYYSRKSSDSRESRIIDFYLNRKASSIDWVYSIDIGVSALIKAAAAQTGNPHPPKEIKYVE
jgi:hypothetical protein